MENYEAKITAYVKATDNAVLYEVVPIYKGSELVARGVQVQAKSIDLGKKDSKKLAFNVYLYNKNPGWTIDYATGNFEAA
jgi:DNA-entry nuclease